MGTGHKIEVFTAGCPLCVETVKILMEAMCPKCTLKEYNVSEKCEDLTCMRKVEEYGIRAIPTVVVDGQVRIEGKPTLELVKRILGTNVK